MQYINTIITIYRYYNKTKYISISNTIFYNVVQVRGGGLGQKSASQKISFKPFSRDFKAGISLQGS